MPRVRVVIAVNVVVAAVLQHFHGCHDSHVHVMPLLSIQSQRHTSVTAVTVTCYSTWRVLLQHCWLVLLQYHHGRRVFVVLRRSVDCRRRCQSATPRSRPPAGSAPSSVYTSTQNVFRRMHHLTSLVHSAQLIYLVPDAYGV